MGSSSLIPPLPPLQQISSQPAPSSAPSLAAAPGAVPNLAKAASAEERLVMGEEYDKTVTELTGMGFSKEDVTRALKAAFNNPERAAEYLVSVRLLPHFCREYLQGPSALHPCPAHRPDSKSSPEFPEFPRCPECPRCLEEFPVLSIPQRLLQGQSAVQSRMQVQFEALVSVQPQLWLEVRIQAQV